MIALSLLHVHSCGLTLCNTQHGKFEKKPNTPKQSKVFIERKRDGQVILVARVTCAHACICLLCFNLSTRFIVYTSLWHVCVLFCFIVRTLHCLHIHLCVASRLILCMHVPKLC